jgi:hypothetical protein
MTAPAPAAAAAKAKAKANKLAKAAKKCTAKCAKHASSVAAVASGQGTSFDCSSDLAMRNYTHTLAFCTQKKCKKQMDEHSRAHAKLMTAANK